MNNNPLENSLFNIGENEEIPRDSIYYENQVNNFMGRHEGEQIVNDIQLLRDMGYENRMINKIYILLHPESIERAIDYMTEINGVFQHNFFENNYRSKDRDLCFICKTPRRCHLDYIPNEFLDNNDINLDFNNNINNNLNNNNNLVVIPKQTYMCTVCFEEMDEEEKNHNSLPCGHLCCTQCWINYLETLINEAKVEKIKCIDHKCTEILTEEFILKYIGKDSKIIKKYEKFKKRAEIFNNPNKKQCPEPNCDSFLQKSKSTNYVKCELGHKYCFECLRKPHGKSSCEKVLEKDFKLWSKGKVIKKCPKCKIYTEKNEGCNHMTCTSCKYQWCWLCEGEYKYGHYNQGACNGHQFTKVNYLSEIKSKAENYNYNRNNYNPIIHNNNYNDNLYYNIYDNNIQSRRNTNYFIYDEKQEDCCCRLSSVFCCCLHEIFYTHADIDGYERLNALLILFFGYFLFSAYQIYNTSYDDYIYYSNCFVRKAYKFFGYLISFFLFICYQTLFSCIILPFILISMICPFCVYKIKMFFTIGNAHYYHYFRKINRNNSYIRYSYHDIEDEDDNYLI